MRPVLPASALPPSGPGLCQFAQFGLVGLSGFGVVVLVVYGLRHSIGLIRGGLVAYFAATTSNEALSRVSTFLRTNRIGLCAISHCHRRERAPVRADRGTFRLPVTFVPPRTNQLTNCNHSRPVVFR